MNRSSTPPKPAKQATYVRYTGGRCGKSIQVTVFNRVRPVDANEIHILLAHYKDEIAGNHEGQRLQTATMPAAVSKVNVDEE
ncbi:hypothetical protein GCM10011402_38460 [Paracoccus acridae]|uniref:Uncharacterized protein n=1 Tax=Paracoccus acridae TaxID=1795310 RepID=A0ABQ1VMS0_9RHOB|nr:hypothetical protein GCM10011402_38460 [Paracoccus acridae]